MVSSFKSRLLFRKFNEKLYTIYLRPVLLQRMVHNNYRGDYNKLSVFGKKNFKKTLFDDSEQKWLERSNEKLKNPYTNEDIVQIVRGSLD